MPPLEQVIPKERWRSLSTLQLVDIISHKLVMQGAIPADMTLLRRRVEEMEEMQDQARAAVEKLSEAVDKLRAPALRLGTLPPKTAQRPRARLHQRHGFTSAASIRRSPKSHLKRAIASSSMRPSRSPILRLR